MVYFIFYVIAISLQLSGAILLLFSSLSTKRSKIVKEFAQSKIITEDSNTKDIFYNNQSFMAAWENVHQNRFAFAYISVGYLAGIWGEISNEQRCKALVYVSILSTLIIVSSRLVIKQILKHSRRANKSITNDELTALGVEPATGSIEIDKIADIMKQNDRCDGDV